MLKPIAPLVAATILALAGCSSAPAETSQPASVDLTAEAQAVAGEIVTSATETEPGRIQVVTAITDPRTDPGSIEAQQAIVACEAIVAATGAAHVSIAEADGSTFVIYGHPTYGGTCAEV